MNLLGLNLTLRKVGTNARSLELEPRHFGALSGLGLINQAIGRPEVAIMAFEKASENYPHLPTWGENIRGMKKICAAKKI